ncbi:MAG TPA: YihY/virulence factor BrkB family protein [Opitutaceae bacterium]
MPLQGIRATLVKIWSRDIWHTTLHSDHSPRGWLYALLRVVSIVCTTFSQTKTASRSADLSFSSMLGLGPLVAIGMLVASTVFGQRNPHLAVDLLQRVISFVAPQLNQFDNVQSGGGVPVNADLVALINGFIHGARSSTVGVVGALSLVLIVLFLFKSIEDVFNDIWGVRRGRSLLKRVAFYWTMLTMGGLLFFAAVAVFAVGEFVNVLVGGVPIGIAMAHLARWSLPPASFVLLVGVLAAFYRAIPNTRVRWGAALTGAVTVALLLTANNYVQFLYLRRVLLAKSLFGSLGIIPVLMFGLYVFWLIVLIGGQISYAVQNVDVRNSKLAWNSLSMANRERLSMAVLMSICRNFRDGKPAVSAAELIASMRLPVQLLNECLNRVVDLGFAAPVPMMPGAPDADARYRPARPLNQITLLEFKAAADNLGADPAGDALARSDPVVGEFGEAMSRLGEKAFFKESVEHLLSGEKQAK